MNADGAYSMSDGASQSVLLELDADTRIRTDADTRIRTALRRGAQRKPGVIVIDNLPRGVYGIADKFPVEDIPAVKKTLKKIFGKPELWPCTPAAHATNACSHTSD